MRFRPTLTLLLLATTALAQTQKRPMTFADLQSMKRISDPQVSPSGKWVLFSVTDVSLENNTASTHLWLVPIAGGKETQLTHASVESNGRFSPDGKSISFTHKNQIWLAPFDDATGTLGDDHAITALATGADGAIWAPDSKHILFTSTVYPGCESKTAPGPQHNQEEAACNAREDASADKSPVKAQIFDNLLYRHWNAYAGTKRSHIFYAGTDGGAPEDLTPASVIADHVAPTFSLGGPLGYAISPDGKEIAYEVNLDKVPAESTNNDIFILKVDAPPSTAKKVSTSPGSDDGPQYSPDGKYLAWRSQARAGFESDKFNLDVMDRGTGTIKNLTAKFDGWIDEFLWGARSNEVLAASARKGEERIFYIDINGKTTLLDAHGEFSDIHLIPLPPSKSMLDFRPSILAVQMTVGQPAGLVTVTLYDTSHQTTDGWNSDCKTIKTGSHSGTTQCSSTNAEFEHSTGVEALTHLNDAILSSLDLAKMESFTFPGANNTGVEGFLIRPPNFDPAKKYPLKFLIHGGPQGAWGDAWSYRWNPELFAANGYVVVMINPRGSTGYGQKFVDEVSGDWGGRPYIDLMKGLDYAEKTYPFIDKTRECALGGSYGGFMANYILTHTHRFACIVSHDGMYNPQSAFGTTEELWFNEWEFRPLAHPKNVSSRPKAAGRSGETPVLSDADPDEATSGGEPQDPDATVEQKKPAHPWDFYNLPASQDPFRKFSPMESIANAKTPTLIIHGQLDYRLDVSEAFQLFTALKLRHVPSKMLYFPDEGHWVLKPQNSQLWYHTVNDWVDQWTHTNAYADTPK
jgi:dipeptidyl aminopeptidase/acylaminoacyl peptidase